MPAVNLVRLEGHVYYRIKRKPDGRIDEDAAFTYYYSDTDTALHLEKLAYRAMCRVAASQDFLKWIAEERTAVVQQYLQAVREAAEKAALGLEVVDATINAVHPPAEIARAYEQVVAALEQRESSILEGEKESIRKLNRAEARRVEVLKEASAYAYRERTLAEADAAKFLIQLDAYRKAPQVYLHRTYFDTMEEALKDQRVYVVPVSQNEVQIIDLQEKIRTSILEDLDALEE